MAERETRNARASTLALGMTLDRSQGVARRALRPSFVVTFALSAASIAGGCSSKDSSHGNGSIGDGSIGESSIGDSSIGDDSIGDGGCPAEQPTNGAPCDLPSSARCFYDAGTCYGQPVARLASCQQGTWSLGSFGPCNPPAGYDAGNPNVYDAGPDCEGGPDVHDGGPDGEGQDGGHD
jgi:hypothetical protein